MQALQALYMSIIARTLSIPYDYKEFKKNTSDLSEDI